MIGQQFEKVDGMIDVHSMPYAFTAGECERIIAITARVPADEARLVSRQREHNYAKLNWFGWMMSTAWVGSSNG